MESTPANVTRRDFLKGVVAAAAASNAAAQEALFPRVQGLAAATAAKPNIIYIHSHDTGRFTSPYGHRAATPNLQRLAEDGICFTQAHSAAPTCSPSRASLLTGQCPHSNGMLGLAHRGFSLVDYHRHILHTLRKEAGYTSALIGLQHIAKNPKVIGYDHLEVIPGNHVEKVAPAAVRFLSQKQDAPFWLEIGFQETHRPYRPAAGSSDPRYMLPPKPVPNVPATREDIADFHTTLAALDRGIGQILKTIEEQGLSRNTLIISTTDHGIAFPEMKCNLYDTGTGVHLVIRGPGGFSGGKVCDALISQIDLFPTVCELLGIAPPSWLEGRSFLPIVRGAKAEINEEIFAEVNYHAAYEPMRAVRTQRWKYIRRFHDYAHPVLPNCDDGPSKSFWLQNGWARQPVVKEELYDVVFDPQERCNLIADPQRQSDLATMRRSLASWMDRTSDPLLRGPIPPPKGAEINQQSQESPKDPATET